MGKPIRAQPTDSGPSHYSQPWSGCTSGCDGTARRKRQHLKNQVQWYGRRESKHHCSAYNDRSRVQQPMFGERQNALLLLSKPSAKTIQWSGSPRLWLTPTQKKKPQRYLRGNALGIDRASRRETRLSEPFRSRHQARLTIARQRSRNALNRIWCIIYRPVKMN